MKFFLRVLKPSPELWLRFFRMPSAGPLSQEASLSDRRMKYTCWVAMDPEGAWGRVGDELADSALGPLSRRYMRRRIAGRGRGTPTRIAARWLGWWSSEIKPLLAAAQELRP